MLIVIPMVPQRVRTVAQFNAADPWNGGRPAPFTIEAYKLVPRGGRAPNANPAPTDFFGIRSNIDGAERFLPEALSELYAQKSVAAESLPALLADLQPSLRKSDVRPVLHTKRHWWLAAIFGSATLVFLAFAILWLVKAMNARGHAPSRAPVAEWLRRPQVLDEYIETQGTVRIEGKSEVDFVPHVPPALVPFPAPRYVLAWFRAGDGYRLLLEPAAHANAMPEVPINGVTVRPASIGLPERALDELRRRLPRLDASLVTCEYWAWDDAYSSPLGAALWGALAFITAAGGAVPFFIIVRQQARRRRQMAWVLSRR